MSTSIADTINRTEKILEIATRLLANKVKHINVTYNDGSQKMLRIFKSTDGHVCAFYPNRRRSGYRLPVRDITHIEPIVKTSRKSDEQKWEDAWKKVIAKLEKSGLWEKVVNDIKIALNLGYHKMMTAYDIFWKHYDQRLEIFKKDFPELVMQNKENENSINTSIVFHYAKMPKVKKMRFDKWRNDHILAGIQLALASKTPHQANGRYNYDVSFEYDAEKNKAWYSEEFKGRGNGHYYLALDATHALFRESD